MDPKRYLTYGLALVLLIVAWKRRGNRLKARQIKCNVVVGNNAGTINQSYSASTAGDEHTPPTVSEGDRVGWVIGTVGVLIAAAQLAYDLYR